MSNNLKQDRPIPTTEALNKIRDAEERLRDAAPDLLAACKSAVHEAYDIAHSSGDPADPAQTSSVAFLYRELTAAIAKAEGK